MKYIKRNRLTKRTMVIVDVRILIHFLHIFLNTIHESRSFDPAAIKYHAGQSVISWPNTTDASSCILAQFKQQHPRASTSDRRHNHASPTSQTGTSPPPDRKPRLLLFLALPQARSLVLRPQPAPALQPHRHPQPIALGSLPCYGTIICGRQHPTTNLIKLRLLAFSRIPPSPLKKKFSKKNLLELAGLI